MPDGKTHDMLTVVTAVVGIPIMLAITPDRGLGGALIWSSAHVISGMAFSPDLDLASEPYRRWGPLRFIWLPYRNFIHHRSWISHSLVIGPLLRIAYFLLMITGVIWVTLTLLNGIVPVDSRYWMHAFWNALVTMWVYQRTVIWLILAGFITGSAVHSIADWTISGSEPFHRSLLRWTPFGRRRRRRSHSRDW